MSSTPINKNARARFLKGTLAATVLAATATGLLGAPAQAAEPWHKVDTDGVAINGGHSDFGTDLHLGGFPSEGSVTFYVKNGNTRAVVHGQTYLDDLAGNAARTHIRYEKSNGAKVGEDNGPEVSSTEGGLHQSGLWSRQHIDPQIARVTIYTQLKVAGGNWATTGQKTVCLGGA